MSIFQKFTVNSTLEFTSDHFALGFVGSQPFREKTATDVVTLKVGLRNLVNTPEVITLIKNGPTDEFEVTIRPDSITGMKRGRDGIAAALDAFFEKRYYRFPERVPPYPPIDPTTGRPIPQVDSTGVALPLPAPGVSGIFRASQIAVEAGAAVGVSVSWEIPDYELLTTFIASGRAIDTITQLVQPYTLTTPFKADIYSDGNVLVIRQRNPFQPPDFTISMRDAKRNDLILRVRKTQQYGQVWLTGAPNALAQQHGVWVEGEELIETVDETTDADGTILSRIATTEIKITPTGQTKSKVTETYTRQFEDGGAPDNLVLSTRQTETNDYTIGTFGIVGPIAPKILVSSTTVTEGFDDSGVWSVLREQTRGISYDHGTSGFQTGETYLTKTLQDGVLSPSEMVVKTTRDCGYLLVEQITEKYQFQDATGGGGATTKQAVLVDRDIQRQSGFRAGGINALPRTIGPGTGQQVRLVRTISTSPFAVKVVQSLPNFGISGSPSLNNQLQDIMNQFQQASGMWEYEISMSGVNVPWLKRGMYLKLTDIESEATGTSIELPTLIVTEINTTYDETTENAKSMSHVRAFGWSHT